MHATPAQPSRIEQAHLRVALAKKAAVVIAAAAFFMVFLLARASHPGQASTSGSSGGSGSSSSRTTDDDYGFDLGSGSVAPSTDDATPDVQSSVS